MNPELRRNFWLELSAHRIVAMPIILALIFVVVAALDPDKAMQRLAWVGLAGFGAIAGFWGMRLAANSVFDELVEKTWDSQRLSTLSPWQMTWGKLFGATVYAWYGGLICLGVFVFYASGVDTDAPARTAATLILAAMALHGATFAGALLNARRLNGAPPNRRSFVLLIVFVSLYGGVMSLPRLAAKTAFVSWYGHEYLMPDFVLLSATAAAAWALLGAYRSMCQSLAVATTPWALITFVLFLTFYSAGFAIGNASLAGSQLQIVSVFGLGWTSLVTYLLLFTEPSGPIVVRRVVRKVQHGEWLRALQEIPCWPLAWVLAALFAIILTIAPIDLPPAFAGGWAFSPLPSALLTARDGAILLFFSASPKPARAIGATLIYIAVLDWLIPGLLVVIGYPTLAGIVLPIKMIAGGQLVQTLAALAQAVVAGILAFRRIRSTNRTRVSA